MSNPSGSVSRAQLTACRPRPVCRLVSLNKFLFASRWADQSHTALLMYFSSSFIMTVAAAICALLVALMGSLHGTAGVGALMASYAFMAPCYPLVFGTRIPSLRYPITRLTSARSPLH